MERSRYEGCEVFGSLLLGYVEACVNLNIVAGKEGHRLLDGVVPNGWYALERFEEMGRVVVRNYEKSDSILEAAGAAMMMGWYHHGPGSTLIEKGADFLHFQSGTQGYASVVRGPSQLVGEFNLTEYDEAAGTAVVVSSTPFLKSLERGVLIGGMSAPGDLSFIQVDNQADENVFQVRFKASQKEMDGIFDRPFHKGCPHLEREEIADLYWRYRGLKLEWERAHLFWEVTNNNLAGAYERLDAQGRELAEISRRAGMAEVAADVMHNIGNSANSMSTALHSLKETGATDVVSGLANAGKLLDQNRDSLGAFFAEDPKGRRLIEYMKKLGEALARRQEKQSDHLARLSRLLEEVKTTVALQNGYLVENTHSTVEDVALLVDDALRLQKEPIQRSEASVSVHCEVSGSRLRSLQKSRFLGAFMEIVKNALEAMEGTPKQERALEIRLTDSSSTLQLSVRDTGEGIPEENMAKIFRYGFSTRDDRHGFGLHNCAVHLGEMGCRVCVDENIASGAQLVISFSDE